MVLFVPAFPFFKIYFFIYFLTEALSLAEDKKDSKPPATVSPAGAFSTQTPNTTTTTKNPTTTTPKTTTTKPTTTTPKTTTTTTMTTTPLPPQPTPSANLTGGNYTIMDKDKKVICLMAQMELQIRLATLKVRFINHSRKSPWKDLDLNHLGIN